jgi:hypothetical protein
MQIAKNLQQEFGVLNFYTLFYFYSEILLKVLLIINIWCSGTLLVVLVFLIANGFP